MFLKLTNPLKDCGVELKITVNTNNTKPDSLLNVISNKYVTDQSNSNLNNNEVQPEVQTEVQTQFQTEFQTCLGTKLKQKVTCTNPSSTSVTMFILVDDNMYVHEEGSESIVPEFDLFINDELAIKNVEVDIDTYSLLAHNPYSDLYIIGIKNNSSDTVKNNDGSGPSSPHMFSEYILSNNTQEDLVFSIRWSDNSIKKIDIVNSQKSPDVEVIYNNNETVFCLSPSKDDLCSQAEQYVYLYKYTSQKLYFYIDGEYVHTFSSDFTNFFNDDISIFLDSSDTIVVANKSSRIYKVTVKRYLKDLDEALPNNAETWFNDSFGDAPNATYTQDSESNSVTFCLSSSRQ